MLNLFGGRPAFGYAAAKNGIRRYEDHVGHKVTVATCGAALGDGANTNSQIWPAGFECKWLSKFHQGSWSTDAFKNHLHEYFLALTCDDGPGNTPGTRLSIKFLYTFGRPNEFNSLGCTPNPQFPWNVQAPDGNTIGATSQTSPLPNENANGRESPCYDALGWHPPEDLQQVDLWTQPISIERGGDKPVFLQPYYIVKNPARVLKDSTSVKYAVDRLRSSQAFAMLSHHFLGTGTAPALLSTEPFDHSILKRFPCTTATSQKHGVPMLLEGGALQRFRVARTRSSSTQTYFGTDGIGRQSTGILVR